MMLRDSVDPIVRAAQPTVLTGRKWSVRKAVEVAETSLEMKEVIGAVQNTRAGLGWTRNEWISHQNNKGRRDIVTKEIRHIEE